MSASNIPLFAHCFVNHYISGIHAGIQSAHAIVNMATVAVNSNRTEVNRLYKQWSTIDQTIIVRNAGLAPEFVERRDRCRAYAHEYNLPYGEFEEPGIPSSPLTAFVVIGPEWAKPDPFGYYTNELDALIAECRLA